MKVIGIIPARWQSSRFPGKPLAHLLGKSLIIRTYENALRCKSLDAVVIATDDLRIYNHIRDFGGKAFMTSASCASGTDRAWEVVHHYFQEAEIVVNIQGDEPCLDPDVVDILVKKLSSMPDALITTPVAHITDPKAIQNSNVVKCVFDKTGKALYFSRSPIPFAKNELAATYYRHIGVYCFRRLSLERYNLLENSQLQESEDLEQLKFLSSGLPIHVCIVEDQSIGVDTPEDLKTVEELLCQRESMYS